MAELDLRSLQQGLAQRAPRSLYFLVGEEYYLVDEALKAIRGEALKEGAIDFNFDQFYATDVSGSQIRDAVETLPMMCPRRLVVLKQAHQLKEKDWSYLEPVIKNPVDSTVFVLIAEKVDKRKKYYKWLSGAGIVVNLKRPFDNQVASWIGYIGQQQAVVIDHDAIRLIHQLIGNNLTEVNSEVKKICQFIDGRKNVTSEDVLKVVSRSKIDSVFDLTNAIGKNDRATALACLANLLDHGQSEVGAIALVSRHVRILSGVQEGLKAGLRGAQLSSRVGVPSFFLKDYQQQAQTWGGQKIENTMMALYDTDKALKSSPVSSHIWLENFIIATCCQ